MVNVYITSAFSCNNSGGNLAGVVLCGEAFTEAEKTDLAAKLGLSETAFLSPCAGADLKMEYFTPKGEVPLCGHATIAAFVTMSSREAAAAEEGTMDQYAGREAAAAEEGTVDQYAGREAAAAEEGTVDQYAGRDTDRYTISTKAGILHIERAGDGMVFMEQNKPVFGRKLAPRELAPCFPVDILDDGYPVQIVSTGLRDILVPVDSPDRLKEAVPDFQAMAEISKQQDVIGVHAFSLVNAGKHTAGRELTAVCRNFAPLYGIREESATGTSNCALACYLFSQGIKKGQYIFEQGHNLGSVSRITVRLESCYDEITKVSVGGYGYVKQVLQYDRCTGQVI